MGSRGTITGKVRAGLYEIDLNSGELYKSGRKVALQQLPFRVLRALIEHPGEVVSREDIHNRLWPSDTYVAFDEGLNTAIRKLRAAFGDSADNPRFIETVPRRGYRFIAPLWEENDKYPAESEREANSANPFLQLPTIQGTNPARSSLAGKFVPIVGSIILLCAVTVLIWVLRPSLASPHVVRIRQLTRLGDLQWWIYTDGPRVYFSSGAFNDHRQWRSISVEGGESAPASELHGDWLLQSFSPNSSELLVLKKKDSAPFWRVLLPSGSMQELDPSPVSGAYAADAIWSPDGESIAFVSDTSLCMMKNDGSNVRKLATFHGPPSHPAWSPDGRKIRVAVDKAAGNFSFLGRSLMEVDVATGAVREVALGIASPRQAGWLRGGDYFLFASRERGINDLWIVREMPAGFRKTDSHPVRLTEGPISFDWPIVGRDGKTIFVVGVQPRASMQRYNRTTQQFEPFLGGLSGDHIVYSRDGQWIAYISYPERTLWRCRADGQDCLQLAFAPLHMDGPRWSPDGKQLAFNARAEGQLSKGYIVSANGGIPQPLLSESNTGEESLYWSPDGTRIMYSEVSASSPPRIRIFDLATRQINDVPDSSGFLGEWSPDGNYIVARNKEGKARLFDLRTHRWSDLDEMKGDNWWSADSRYIYFHTLNHIPLDSEADGIFRLRISDRHVEKIMNVPPFKMIGTWGVGTGHMPDDTPLILQDRTTSDLYAIDLDLP